MGLPKPRYNLQVDPKTHNHSTHPNTLTEAMKPALSNLDDLKIER